MDSIRATIPEVELLVGLAEELAEASQAALKLHRVLDGRNPTSVDRYSAEEALLEELADVRVYKKALGITDGMTRHIEQEKEARWKERLM